MNRRITNLLIQHTPNADVLSIDESLFSFKGTEHFLAMWHQAKRDTGIPVSVD